MPKPTIRDKKESTKVVHENHPKAGGTIIHGEKNTVVHNHSFSDYKVDNSAIDQGRAVIGMRQRGERVNTVNMTPKEYENYLHYQFEIPGKKGWSGVERSDFAKNWEPNLSQNIQTREEALKYLGVKETKKSPDGIEKRKQRRRNGGLDIRKDKIERRTYYQRKIDEKNEIKHTIQYVSTVIIWFLIYGVLWGLAK